MGVDWGSAPAWASAILTSGSFALGFYVLLRDRRKEERAEASLIVCWRTWGQDTYTTHIHNASKRTVVDLAVLVRLPLTDERKSLGWEPFPGPSVLKADEEQSVDTPRKIDGKKYVPEFVTFQDADGIFWVRDLSTGDLKRLRTTTDSRSSRIDKYASSVRHGDRGWISSFMTKLGRSEHHDA